MVSGICSLSWLEHWELDTTGSETCSGSLGEGPFSTTVPQPAAVRMLPVSSSSSVEGLPGSSASRMGWYSTGADSLRREMSLTSVLPLYAGWLTFWTTERT